MRHADPAAARTLADALEGLRVEGVELGVTASGGELALAIDLGARGTDDADVHLVVPVATVEAYFGPHGFGNATADAIGEQELER